jgi:uncharacterized RmlC-like cupin family protein
MRREQAIATDHLWAGHVTTDPGAVSGWHHHGAYESSIYVVSGSLVMESGPGGADRIAASAGDFIYVPPGAIHRESNPGADASTLVVVRAGQGPPTINVDGPAPAEH